jgi:hypothetical protein
MPNAPGLFPFHQELAMADDRNQKDRTQTDRTQNDRTENDRVQPDRTQRDQNQGGRQGGLEGSPGGIDRDESGLGQGGSTGRSAGAGKRDRIGNADVPDSTQVPWNAERGEPDYNASRGGQRGDQRDDIDSSDRDQNER